MKWDGEWHITYEVFRDLGLAFAAVIVLIYILVVGWFQSFITPLVIMAAIPFSLIGILPAHGLLHAFFTATSMIGFIAGAGIVVRNSIILVDFIELRLREGRAARGGRGRRRRGPLPADDADRRGGGGGLDGDPLRPDLPGAGDCLDGGRDRVARALPHDRTGALLHGCETPAQRGTPTAIQFNYRKGNSMTVERTLRIVAGAFIMASLALGYWVDHRWFLFTGFVGLNLFQSGFSDWCPMITVLKKAGLRDPERSPQASEARAH